MAGTSKIIGVHVENSLIDELEPKLSWDEGRPGVQTGGPPWDPPKGRLEHGPGGECFAPFFDFPEITQVYPGSSVIIPNVS